MLKNIKVKTKLIVSFVIIAIITSIVGIVGTVSLRNVNKNSNAMYNSNFQSIYILSDIKEMITESRSDLLKLVYQKDPAKKQGTEKDFLTCQNKVNSDILSYEKLQNSSSEKQVWGTLKNQVEQYFNEGNNVIKFVDASKFVDADNTLCNKVTPVRNDATVSFDKLMNISLDDAKASNLNSQSIYKSSNIIMTILSLIGFIIAIGFGIVLSKDIHTPLSQMLVLAESLAKFDLTNNFSIERTDEFGKTNSALIKAQENVRKLIESIMSNSEKISMSSEKISTTVQDLSIKAKEIDNSVTTITEGIQETSASSEEINASVEEVNSSINELSNKAMEGSNNANKSNAIASIFNIFNTPLLFYYSY